MYALWFAGFPRPLFDWTHGVVESCFVSVIHYYYYVITIEVSSCRLKTYHF